jgi:phage terminase large subunit
MPGRAWNPTSPVAPLARAISKRSWSILIPTIRKPGSEIWVSFNPELDTDETYARFVLNPPPDAEVVKISYHDNPWFPEVLERERLYSKEHDPEDYDNIWEGACKAAVSGAIYAKEMGKIEVDQRVQNLPYDPRLKVHVVCDLGWNDAMTIGLFQRNLSELRVIDYIEDSHRTIDSYSAELREKRLNWGKFWVPHDAKHETLAASGQSVEQLLRKLGWSVESVPQIGVEPGIKAARMALGRSYFDRTKTQRLRECLKRYRRTVPKTTDEPTSPIHDEFSHGADMFRYAAIVADKMKNEDMNAGAAINYDNRGII